MPALFRITHQYSLLGGIERAAHTLHVLTEDNPTALVVALELSPKFAARWPQLRPFYHPTTVVERLRYDKINPANGTVIEGADGVLPVGPAGSASGQPLPPQLAPVITLRTQFSGGRFRGRMYTPAPAIGSVDNGRITTLFRDTLRTEYTSYLQFIYDTPAVDWKPVIFSRAAGGSTPISAVEVGNVYDTQRGRRDRLVEVRVSGSLVP